MDNLTHSLAGLTLAKAGLERASPAATTVCILAANAADGDVVSVLFGRWNFLQYHRGFTHSVLGTVIVGLLIPLLFWLGDFALARLRNRARQVRLQGLLLASMIAGISHPLMDWTNNYGIRLWLPWSARWVYGDLVFIVDPYIWLALGAAAFLLTKQGRTGLTAWVVIGVVTTALILLGPAQNGGLPNPVALRVIWLIGLTLIGSARGLKIGSRLGSRLAVAALAVVLLYWGVLFAVHRLAFDRVTAIGAAIALRQNETVVKAAAMPTLANPFRWQCLVETDRAVYRFFVKVNRSGVTPDPDGNVADLDRFPKPTDAQMQVVSAATRDPRASALLNFSRFPLARVEEDNCVGQALVQFVDLRYTDPGAPPRGTFGLEVPVACPK